MAIQMDLKMISAILYSIFIGPLVRSHVSLVEGTGLGILELRAWGVCRSCVGLFLSALN